VSIFTTSNTECLGCVDYYGWLRIKCALMRCEKCGMELRPGARFCRSCGVKVVLRPGPAKREDKDVMIFPITDKTSSRQRSSNLRSDALPPLAGTLRETVPLGGEVNQSSTYDLRRQSEAKPFFTLETDARPNPQHIRMIALVPVLLLLVILLFVFAFIAAR
jgi:zinc-ribbon domain